MKQKTDIKKLLKNVTEVYCEMCQVLKSVTGYYDKVPHIFQSVTVLRQLLQSLTVTTYYKVRRNSGHQVRSF